MIFAISIRLKMPYYKARMIFPAEVVEEMLDGKNPIKAIREYRGLTQRDLADKIGNSVPYLSQIENHKRQGSLKVLSEIARALDGTLEMILVEVE